MYTCMCIYIYIYIYIYICILQGLRRLALHRADRDGDLPLRANGQITTARTNIILLPGQQLRVELARLPHRRLGSATRDTISIRAYTMAPPMIGFNDPLGACV